MQAFKDLDLFEQYILNTLRPEQKAEFDERLKTDEGFALEWAEYQFMIQDFEQSIGQTQPNAEADAIRDQLRREGFFQEARKQVEQELAEEVVPQAAPAPMIATRGGLWRRWAVAAGLALVVVAGWLLRQQIRADHLATLERNWMQQKALELPNLSGMSDTDTFEIVRKIIFIDKDPDKAANLLNQLTGTPSQERQCLWAWVKYLKKEYDLALGYLSNMLVDPDPVSRTMQWDAQILAAHCYLGKKDKASARILLQKIILSNQDTENKYRKEAEGLLAFL